MIVPMKKITVLCTAHDRLQTLAQLQEAGALHLKVDLQTPRYQNQETSILEFAEALEALKPGVSAAEHSLPDADANRFLQAYRGLKHARKELADATQLVQRYQPWGTFHPEQLRSLENQGWHLQLFEWPLSRELPVVEDAVWFPIGKPETIKRVVLVSRKPVTLSEAPVPLPEASLETLMKKESEAKAAEQAALEIFQQFESRAGALKRWLEDQQNIHLLDKLAHEMESSGPVAWIQGFIPADLCDTFTNLALQQKWGILLEDPSPEDEVPTQLRYPKWIEPIKVILDAINVSPGYREADPGPVFLLFFSIFFSMLIGDAGYGVLFLILTFAGRLLSKSGNTAVFRLLTITSASTVLWGALSGTWFGVTTGLGIMEQVKIDWLLNQNNVMQLCFLLGAVHLTVAHGWNVLRMAPAPAALAQIGWIALTWVMYFLAGNLVLRLPMPEWVLPLFGAGALLIALFMTPLKQLKTEWYGHVMLPLNFVSHFVDVVSYLRLFAVGAASLAVAASFNTMALKNGIPDVMTGLVAAFILFAGHTLNIVLGAMGVLVHGVRLNTLEFSSHLGVQWTGRPYRPFRKSA
jgi:V/A-type H+-transporting ATPase subunit I